MLVLNSHSNMGFRTLSTKEFEPKTSQPWVLNPNHILPHPNTIIHKSASLVPPLQLSANPKTHYTIVDYGFFTLFLQIHHTFIKNSQIPPKQTLEFYSPLLSNSCFSNVWVGCYKTSIDAFILPILLFSFACLFVGRRRTKLN